MTAHTRKRLNMDHVWQKTGKPGIKKTLWGGTLSFKIEENLDYTFSFKIEENLDYLLSFKIEENLENPFSFKIEENLDYLLENRG